MEPIFFELTVVICVAAALAVFFRFLKQPAILAYILTGVLLGPMGFVKLDNGDVMNSLGQIGITLLLFVLGLELKLRELRSVGRVAILTGVGQILFTTAVGFFICVALGFSHLAALYMAIALTFSSTIVIVKLLSDKNDLNSLYGKLAVGILLVQDFVAVLALIFLSGFQSGGQVTFWDFVYVVLKAVVLTGWVIVFSKTLIPKLMNKLARSSELLFLFTLAWAFGVCALISSPFIGFSIEIGGFLAGLALANSTENFQIVAKIRSLRDFFITLFFVSLGMGLVFQQGMAIWLPAVILAAYVLIGNPVILMSILGILGYRKRTSFMVGLTVSQISEFSIIVVLMGNKLNHVSDEVVSVVTLAGAISFIFSTYMIMNGNGLHKKMSGFLSFFERENTHEQLIKKDKLVNHVILAGASRMGEGILDVLIKSQEKLLVIDFDPDIISRLVHREINCLFGDISDYEILEKAQIEDARLVISTVPDIEDNLLLLEAIRGKKKKALAVMCAQEASDAIELYKNGADYVMLPQLAGGRHLARLLVEKDHMEVIESYRARDKLALKVV